MRMTGKDLAVSATRIPRNKENPPEPSENRWSKHRRRPSAFHAFVLSLCATSLSSLALKYCSWKSVPKKKHAGALYLLRAI
jgi:hypothetical protein